MQTLLISIHLVQHFATIKNVVDSFRSTLSAPSQETSRLDSGEYPKLQLKIKDRYDGGFVF